MSESNTPNSAPLEAQSAEDERAKFQADMKTLTEAWLQLSGTYEFEAVLPSVIGELPYAERELFSTYAGWKNPEDLDSEEILFEAEHPVKRDGFEVYDVERLFPQLCELIVADAQMLGLDPKKSGLFDGLFQRSFVHAATNQRIPQWHVDVPEILKGHPYFVRAGVLYLVADAYPTEFYEGPATLIKKEEPGGGGLVYEGLDLDQASLESTIPPVAASPFAVVRMTPITVHRSPIIPVDTWRTFMQVSVAA